jgi:transaldolase
MDRPDFLLTQIFLDSGDPKVTREIRRDIEFLDGQTTNPTLVAKNPSIKERRESGEVFTQEELLKAYKIIVQEIRAELPDGSISIEVPADAETTAQEMIALARRMNMWTSQACIKLPITTAGLEAASVLVKEEISVNMTLCFSQEQAAAVHAATKGAAYGTVFVSPFDGRLDDVGIQGDDVLENIIRMYRIEHSHVMPLAASIRDFESFLWALRLGSAIVTAPPRVLKEWIGKGLPVPAWSMPDVDEAKGLRDVPYKEFDLEQSWETFDIRHELTDKGLEKFAHDWDSLLGGD